MIRQFTITRFLGSAGLVVGYRAIGLVVGIFIQLFIARTLPAEDLGTYFSVTSLAAVAGILASLGYPLMTPKFIVTADSDHRKPDARSFLDQARRDILIVSGVMAIAGVATAHFLTLGSGTFANSFWIGMACIPFVAMIRFNGSVANSMKRFSLGFFPDLTFRPVMLAMLLVACWMFGYPLGIEQILLLFLLIAGAVALWQQMRIRSLEHGEVESVGNPDKAPRDTGGMRSKALSLLTGMVFLAASADVAILFASWFLNGKDLAVFGICLKMAMICGFAINAVQQVAIRDIGDALQNPSSQSVQHVLSITNRVSFGVAASGVLAALIGGKFILGFFGPDYIEGDTCLVILMCVNLSRAMAGPSLQMVSLVNAETVTHQVFLSTVIVLLTLTALLASAYGLLGASFSFLLAMSVWPFWLSHAVHRKTGITPTLSWR